MITGPSFGQTGKDFLERAASKVALASKGEVEASFAITTHQALSLQTLEEAFEVDRFVDVALLLQVAHPLHRFVDITTRCQEKLVEQTKEIESGEDCRDDLGIEISIAMTQGSTLL